MSKNKLKDCPNSPNCVGTQATKSNKKMKPLLYQGTIDEAIKKLKAIMSNRDNTKLIKEEHQYLHYEFKTSIGGFIDDVEFLLDEKKKQIDFRSASQKGYFDFWKNKRRMKKIQKEWEQ